MVRRRPGLGLWVGVLGGGVVAEVWLLVGPLSRVTWKSPTGLFAIVTVAASLCAVAAVPVLVRAHRIDSAEMGMLGAAMFNLSVLPLVHGLTAPGVLYGPNAAVTVSVLLAGPVAVATCAPLVVPHAPFARWIAARWRSWAMVWMACGIALGSVLLARPDVIPAPAPRSLVPLTVMVTCFGAMATVSWRQLRLYWVSRHRAFLGASIAVAFVALTSTVWMGREPFTIGWWAVHALDICGVFGVLGGLWLAPKLRRAVIDVLEPVLARDPLAALEIGLAPVVHEFVADLERKDRITRDHVVRVGELAGRTGEALRLSSHRLRNTILGALLHDIGKIGIDDAVLTKPGRLSDDEFREIQRHAAIGATMIAAVPSLAGVAPIVRAHHERYDGAGYPDGIAGSAIPLEARVVAACDAYDAMTYTRHYREGMGRERAVAILREHAGSQWDPTVVETVVAVTARDPIGVFDKVGTAAASDALACSCLDALPVAAHSQFADAPS